jgi:hypothetical protein
MKKTLGILAIFALVATAAFAEVTFGAWGRGLFVPVEGTSESTTYDTTTSWGADNARVGATIAGSTEAGDIGFQIDFNGDGASIGAGDNQFIWAQPIEGLRLAVGKIEDNTLRGDETFGGFNWLRSASNSWTGEGITFARTDADDGDNSQGAEIKYQGYGFTAIAMIRDPSGLTNDDGDAYDFADMFSDMNFDAAYTIEDIGMVKAGIHSNLDDSGFYQVAFDLKAVEKLGASFGIKLPQDADVSGYNYVVSASGNYTIDAAKLHFYGIETLTDGDNTTNAAIGADYGFDMYGLSSDLTIAKTGDADATIGGTIGIVKNLSSGCVGVAFQANKTGDADAIFAIPVKVEYWF